MSCDGTPRHVISLNCSKLMWLLNIFIFKCLFCLFSYLSDPYSHLISVLASRVSDQSWAWAMIYSGPCVRLSQSSPILESGQRLSVFNSTKRKNSDQWTMKCKALGWQLSPLRLIYWKKSHCMHLILVIKIWAKLTNSDFSPPVWVKAVISRADCRN